MRFRMIDRIVELNPGERITAEKHLRAEEDYLEDHFPQFPVMPGVLMLEAMYQSAMWLVRRTDDFAWAVVVLKEVRSIKFADFVEPGEVLVLNATILKQDDRTVTLKTSGHVNDSVTVTGRLILERFNQAETRPDYEPVDARTRMLMRKEFNKLYRPGGSEVNLSSVQSKS
jgi:3-hydroxyacyl-[acyl-carrier-protein] dehydratase